MVVGADTEDTETGDKDGHLRGGKPEQVSLIDEQVLSDVGVALPEVVAEAVPTRLEPGEALFFGLLLAGVATTGRHADTDLHATGCGGRFHGGGTA